MFAKAFEKVIKFTHPMIASIRTVDGKLSNLISTYFIINHEGWAISAGHNWNSFQKFQEDVKHIQEVNSIWERDKAEGKASEVKMDPEYITNHSLWFGADGIRFSTVKIMHDYDVALFKLENLPQAYLDNVAEFSDNDAISPGTSLCRVGYPFLDVKSEFSNNNFKLALPPTGLSPFPNDGIVTRLLVEKCNEHLVREIEMSTPGLKGQSGGPIFDRSGNVVGMQSKTMQLPLGFAPHVKVNGTDMIENQFLNLGIGIGAIDLKQILIQNNVKFYTVSRDSEGCTYIIN